MPAKASIHNHRPVLMDAGFRRYDTRVLEADARLQSL
jgi:hypothetical protein